MDGRDNEREQDAVNRSPARGIRFELDAVDLSPLDELDRMRRELGKVEEYRAKAAALKDQVTVPVWQRVADDYARRASDLGRQAQPLRDRAVVECRKLQVIASRVLAACDQTELVKAELEFRHAVGELDGAEFSKRLEGPLATLAKCQDEKTAVEDYKARFVGALGGTWDAILASPASVEKAASQSPEMTNVLPQEANQTIVIPSAAPAARAPVASHVKSASSGPGAESAEDVAPTVVVPPAALVIGPSGAGQGVHRLAALNYLGRAEDNQIRMTQQGVSRKHALVTITPRGFSIKDLGSQNGTFVNGGRITEHVLADGDAIDIGHAKLVFRSPWPQNAGPASSESSRR